MMNKNTLWKKGSRILAMILAGSMIASLGTDVTSATNVYAAEATEKDAEEQTGEEKTAEKGSTEEKSTEEKSTEEESAEEKKSEEKSTEDQSAEKEKSEAESTEESTKEEKSEEKSKEESTEEKSAEVKDSEQQTAEEKSTEVKDSDKNTSAENTSNKEVSKDTTTNTSNAKATNGFEDDEDEGSEQDTTVLNADYDKDYATKADDAVVDDDPLASIIAVAQSQVGYTQQIKDETKDTVYTLYGNWYNNEETYSDWQSVFAAYCMSKAGLNIAQELPDDDESETIVIPVSDNLSDWISTLDENGFYMDKETMNAEAEEYDDEEAYLYAYSLYAGDIAFLDLDDNGDVDHVGIVTETDGNEYGQDITSLKLVLGAYTDDNDNNADDADDTTAKVAEITLDNTDAVVASIPVQSIVANDAKTLEENSTGVDIATQISDAKFYKSVNKEWVESTEFTTDDDVKGTVYFSSVKTSDIKNGSYQLYIDLPATIDCSGFTDTYKAYDGSVQSGTYKYVQNADGSWRIVMTLFEDYVNNAGDTIDGHIDFDFSWDKDKLPSGGQKEITIGDWNGNIDVQPGTKTESKYRISKNAGSLRWDANGKYVYVDYTVYLQVKKDVTPTDGYISINDVLTAAGFTYDTDSIKITPNNSAHTVKAEFVDTTDSDTGSKTDIKITPTDGSSTIKADTYTITYSVKNKVEASSTAKVTVPDKFKNEITITDDGGDHSDSKTTDTRTATITKSGSASQTGSDIYIDYTIKLNAGEGYVQYLYDGAHFTDEIPSNVTLQGNVTVKQYDYTGQLKSTTTAEVKDGKIDYTTPTGQYYYVITYRVKVNDNAVGEDGKVKVTNTGNSEGGIDGSSTSDIDVTKSYLKKEAVEQSWSQGAEDKTKNVIQWKSTISVEGSLEGYTYSDYAVTNSMPKVTVTMTDEQFNNIVVKKDGVAIDNADGSKYTITKWTDKYDSNNNDKNVGLFKIEFLSDDVKGPVTIEYSTTSDLSDAEEGGGALTFTNYAILTKGEYSEKKQATTQITYQTENWNVIHKYGGSWDDTGHSTSITLAPGETSIPWTIQVNQGRNLTGTLVVTDTIVDGLTLLEDTLLVTVNGTDLLTAEPNNASYTYKDGKLTITIQEAGYIRNNANCNIIISFRTKLPDSYFTGDDLTSTFKNTAKLQYGDSTAESSYSQEVTRQVVGKNGSYSGDTKTLTYDIVVNPDASELNGGNSLKVQDWLTTNSGNASHMDDLELKSLKVFTAIKTYNNDGTLKEVQPGAWVETLTKVDSFKDVDKTSHENDFTYTVTDTRINSSMEEGKGEKAIKFTTYLPDSTAYVIVAEYNVNYDPSEETPLKNYVKLSGSQDWSGKDENTKLDTNTSAGTSTKMDRITLTKRDVSNYSTVIPGAKFQLYQYSGGGTTTWITVGSEKTSADKSGQIVWGAEAATAEDHISRNTLYKLVETAAPDGYVKDDTPTYLIIVEEGSESTAKDDLPESIDGEATYSKDAVEVYTVKANADNKTYYANALVDRYNAKDKNKVEPGELAVNKVWADASGTTITDAAQLANMNEVKVTLTMHSDPKVTVIFSGTSSSSNTVTLVPGTKFYSDWGSTFEVADESADYAQYVKISSDKKTVTISKEATGSINLTTSAYANNDFIESLQKDKSDIATDKVDKVIGTVALNNENAWYYKWSNLDRSEGVTYTLVETAVDGYSTTYTINGTALDPKTPWTPDAKGDKIVVTNKNDKTSISVKKKWNGAATDSISVTLKRYKTDTNPKDIDTKYMGTATLSGTATYPNGTEWEFDAKDKYPPGIEYTFYVKYSGTQTDVKAPELSHNGTAIEPTYEESTKTWRFKFDLVAGQNILTGQVFTNETGTAWTMGPDETAIDTTTANAQRGTLDESFSETVTLDAEGGWFHKFENLDLTYTKEDGSTGYYRYEVVEDTSSLTGYTTTYDYSKYQSGEITITNTKQYDLPKTGGSGTLPWTLGGAALVLSAMAMEVRRRRRYML